MRTSAVSINLDNVSQVIGACAVHVTELFSKAWANNHRRGNLCSGLDYTEFCSGLFSLVVPRQRVGDDCITIACPHVVGLSTFRHATISLLAYFC